MENLIDFSQLTELKKANPKGNSYIMKRPALLNEFIISDTGKTKVGLTDDKGLAVYPSIALENGVVYVAAVDADNAVIAKKLKGNKFKSTSFANALDERGLKSETYDFKYIQEQNGVHYFQIIGENFENFEEPTQNTDNQTTPMEEVMDETF
jgi:hypothetical protein